MKAAPVSRYFNPFHGGYYIAMVFDAGGTLKPDSSIRINQATGHEGNS